MLYEYADGDLLDHIIHHRGYTIVDDWYQQHAPTLLAGKSGKKPLFSDSEVMTLSLAQHWPGMDEEREFLRLVRNNHLPLFPRLVHSY